MSEVCDRGDGVPEALHISFCFMRGDEKSVWVITYTDGTQDAYSDENPLELIVYWVDRKKKVARIEHCSSSRY